MGSAYVCDYTTNRIDHSGWFHDAKWMTLSLLRNHDNELSWLTPLGGKGIPFKILNRAQNVSLSICANTSPIPNRNGRDESDQCIG